MKKLLAKKYIMNGMFYERDLGLIKWISQTKDKEILKNVCMRELLKNSKAYLNELHGIYLIVTHDGVFHILEKFNLHVIKIIEYKNQGIKNLHENLMKNTKCKNCERSRCIFRDENNFARTP